MISKQAAKGQIARLSQMLGFPRGEAAALGELVLAVECAESESIAQRVVSDVLELATSETRCPMPRQLRQSVWERQNASKQESAKCKLCDGGGFITVWQLVTYRGNSLTVQSREEIPEIRCQEQSDEFQRRIMALNDNQIVLSAAKPCRCLPTTHKAFTGEG